MSGEEEEVQGKLRETRGGRAGKSVLFLRGGERWLRHSAAESGFLR